MANSELGRLEEVSLREHWGHEACDFTPWLAQPDNLALLGKALQMELELERQEADVGDFRADIVCRNLDDGSIVLIENQLERTNHAHLGQLLTYAAGLDAVTLVWVVQSFREEHRAVLDWLNRVTEDGFHFFGLEVELWRIGDSVPAPKFNVVVKPNDWARIVRDAATGRLTEIQQLRQDFWVSFATYLEGKGQRDQIPAARPDNWQGWGIGRSGFQLCVAINVRDGRLAVYLNLTGPDVAAHFDGLLQQRGAIERELGFSLEWEEGEKEKKLAIRRDADVADRTKWPEQQRWLHETLQAFRRVLPSRVRALSAAASV